MQQCVWIFGSWKWSWEPRFQEWRIIWKMAIVSMFTHHKLLRYKDHVLIATCFVGEPATEKVRKIKTDFVSKKLHQWNDQQRRRKMKTINFKTKAKTKLNKHGKYGRKKKNTEKDNKKKVTKDSKMMKVIYIYLYDTLFE